MNTSLSPELRALCEWASHEQDPKKLLALTKRINELLEQAERKKAPQTERPPGLLRDPSFSFRRPGRDISK